MNSAIVCIGSNTDNAASMIAAAVDALAASDCQLINDSGIYQVSAPYLNFVAELSCDVDFSTLVALTKSIEREMGRTPQMKAQGIVPIDIDVVVFNGDVMRQRDFDAYYFKPGYSLISQM